MLLADFLRAYCVRVSNLQVIVYNLKQIPAGTAVVVKLYLKIDRSAPSAVPFVSINTYYTSNTASQRVDTTNGPVASTPATLTAAVPAFEKFSVQQPVKIRDTQPYAGYVGPYLFKVQPTDDTVTSLQIKFESDFSIQGSKSIATCQIGTDTYSYCSYTNNPLTVTMSFAPGTLDSSTPTDITISTINNDNK